MICFSGVLVVEHELGHINSRKVLVAFCCHLLTFWLLEQYVANFMLINFLLSMNQDLNPTLWSWYWHAVPCWERWYHCLVPWGDWTRTIPHWGDSSQWWSDQRCLPGSKAGISCYARRSEQITAADIFFCHPHNVPGSKEGEELLKPGVLLWQSTLECHSERFSQKDRSWNSVPELLFLSLVYLTSHVSWPNFGSLFASRNLFWRKNNAGWNRSDSKRLVGVLFYLKVTKKVFSLSVIVIFNIQCVLCTKFVCFFTNVVIVHVISSCVPYISKYSAPPNKVHPNFLKHQKMLF